MKSKFLKLGLFLLGLSSLGALAFTTSNVAMISAEDETTSEVVYECNVRIDATEHGTVTTDITEGHVGDIVTITAKHDLFYLIDSVKVNGTSLVEDETTSGKFVFQLVEGENVVAAKFVIDQELLGSFATIYQQATEKDWTNLFTVENVVTIVKWVFDSGILILMIRYFVKDKKLEKKLEENVKSTMEQLIPETTKETVIAQTKIVLEPIFNQMANENSDMRQCMASLVKCFSLMQEGTPEAKMAILNEIGSLKISDQSTINDVKTYIEEMFKQHEQTYLSAIEKLKSIQSSNAQIIQEKNNLENTQEEQETTEIDNGTQI